ncbi:MAG: DUF721 domain-containing protein [Candidatus Margulisiibacteriota bacterium]
MSLLSKKYKHHLMYSHSLQVIQSNWQGIVNDLSDQIQPINIYRNELIVGCSNPMWMNEIDYFKSTILDKIHQLFHQKKIKLKLVSIKPVFNASTISQIKKESIDLPDHIEDRIRVNIDHKKSSGAILCQTCDKVWDYQKICRLCQLTSS